MGVDEPTTGRSQTPTGNFGGKGQSKGKGKGKKGKRNRKGSSVPPDPQEGEGEEERALKRVYPGPSTMPETWRHKKPEVVVVSGPLPEKPEYNISFQAGLDGNSTFRRTWLVSDAPVRASRVLDNPAGDQRLWAPSDEDFWAVCQPAAEDRMLLKYRALYLEQEVRCRLRPAAKSQELIPRCWCESWIHWQCSYTVKKGRACASHFDVINPLDKTIVTRVDDPSVPEPLPVGKLLPLQ